MTASLHRSYALDPPKRSGGLPCLDFVNTETWRGEVEQRDDRLTSYDELLFWAQATELLAPVEAKRLRTLAAAEPQAAATALAEAKALRAALGTLLLPGTPDDARSLETVNRLLALLPPPQLHRDGLALQVTDAAGDRPLLRPLWPVLRDALALLSKPEWRSRVHGCGNARCGWLFLDLSRNGLRRWCSMDTCGNRAKARRHYAGQRGKAAF